MLFTVTYKYKRVEIDEIKCVKRNHLEMAVMYTS